MRSLILTCCTLLVGSSAWCLILLTCSEASLLAAALSSAGQYRPSRPSPPPRASCPGSRATSRRGPLGRVLLKAKIEVSTCNEEERKRRGERSERAEEQGVSGVEEGVAEVVEEGNTSRGGRREKDCTEEGEETRERDRCCAEE
ncbi:hypothetical protein C8R44DRAFT_810453 [Mycena epipterygia]|nr:hypothetical protein C8R44DRAFT_810453 [Mycena epipterygia]